MTLPLRSLLAAALLLGGLRPALAQSAPDSLAQAASSMATFSAGSHYAINILAADQKELAERFASKRDGRWADVAFTESESGLPLLDGAAATFECFNRSRYQEGDHTIFVGEVERCTHRAGASPLLFHGGKFYSEHPL